MALSTTLFYRLEPEKQSHWDGRAADTGIASEPAHPGRTDPRCKTCSGRGWTTRTAYESCREDKRQEVVKLKG